MPIVRSGGRAACSPPSLDFESRQVALARAGYRTRPEGLEAITRLHRAGLTQRKGRAGAGFGAGVALEAVEREGCAAGGRQARIRHCRCGRRTRRSVTRQCLQAKRGPKHTADQEAGHSSIDYADRRSAPDRRWMPSDSRRPLPSRVRWHRSRLRAPSFCPADHNPPRIRRGAVRTANSASSLATAPARDKRIAGARPRLHRLIHRDQLRI